MSQELYMKDGEVQGKLPLTSTLDKINRGLERAINPPPPPLIQIPGREQPAAANQSLDIGMEDLLLMSHLATQYHNLLLALHRDVEAEILSQVQVARDHIKRFEWEKS